LFASESFLSFFEFRQPFSAWSHLCGMLLAIPATVVLWRRCRGERVKQLCFLVFGVCLALCYAGSAFYHAVRWPEPIVEGLCQTLDYIGIYLLIAGTMTPLGVIVLRGNWRRCMLTLNWGMAGLGIVVRACNASVPRNLSTGFYMGMGWTILLCYLELARRLKHRSMHLAVLGGATYTSGAVLNWLRWPVLWPGVFSVHELFHLFVVGGSLCHFIFMLKIVAPYRPRRATQPTAEPAVGLLKS
jgi:hemolysin III